MNPEDERTKLTATWLNTLASGTILIGLVTPVAALIYGSGVVGVSRPLAILAGAGFTCLGGGLHLIARRALGRSRE